MNNTDQITALLASPQPIQIITPPDEIHVTFTEEDQQKAGFYQDGQGCLLCCAAKRMGYRDVLAGGSEIKLDGVEYLFDVDDPANPWEFYHGQSLVGKTLVLRKQP